MAHDLQFLANMPELCDTTFLVGEERQPICGVKSILAARSRYRERKREREREREREEREREVERREAMCMLLKEGRVNWSNS